MSRSLLVSLLCLSLLSALPVAAQEEARIKQSQQELDRVKSRLQALQGRLKKDRGRQDEVREQLQQAEQTIAASQQRLRELRQEVEAQQRKVESTQREKARAEAALQAQRRALAQQLRAAYQIGGGGQLQMLLNQEGTQKVGRVLAYYDYLNKARATRIQNLFAQLDFVRAIEERLRADLDRLTALRTEQETTVAALEQKRADRSRYIQRLENRIADAVDEMKQLQENEKAIRNLLENLRDVLADIPLDLDNDKPFSQQRGKLPWPVRGKLLATFGQTKAGGKFNWNGLWIATPEGATVRAVARGRIAYAGWMQRYGLIVILEHESGYYSLYGHLLRVPRSEGEWVNAGDTLAFAGNTGGHSDQGVYFEIRKGSSAINPQEWLEK